jgi:hypothetical protein
VANFRSQYIGVNPVLGTLESQETAGVRKHINVAFVSHVNTLSNRYLETGRPEVNWTTRPWVWVALIGLGPIAASLAEQRFYISSVCPSTS